jgi:hypothetical protein
MKRLISVSHEISDEFISDILITAFDGGVGACWYWAVPAPSPRNGRWLYTSGELWESVLVREYENDIDIFVTHTVVAMGLRKILDRQVEINAGLLGHIAAGVAENDAGEIDALCADVIIQAGVFGKVVYG